MMTSLKYSQDTDSNAQMNCSRLNDTIFTKQLMKRLNKYNDDEQVTLQQSIPILYELNIFQQLTSIPDAKRRLTQQSKPNNRLQLQARFVYNLWKLIGNEFISMSYFKQIIGLFITLQISQLALKLQQIFQNQGDLLIEILAIWQAMIENNDGNKQSGCLIMNNDNTQQQQQQEQQQQEQQQQQFRQSSVVTDEQQEQYDENNYNNYEQKHLKQGCNNNSHYNNKMIRQQQQKIHNKNDITVNNNIGQHLQQKHQRHLQHIHQRQSFSNNNNQNNNNINKSTITTSQRQRFNSKSRRYNIQQVTDQIYFNGLYQLPVMSVQKQKQLVNRLYVVNKNQRYQQLKKIQDQQRILKEMQQCTFRPNIDKNRKYKHNRTYGAKMTMGQQQQQRSLTKTTNINTNTATTKKPSSSRTIPGFEKAIQRMKIGQQKTKQLKQKLQLRSSHTTRQSKILEHSKKQLIIQPPSFLTRQTNKKKQQQKKRVLFTIQFDIGRYKLTCKIHENEEAEQLARNIQSIYSLKQQSYQQIKSIIQQEIERYYEMNGGDDNQQYHQYQQQQNQNKQYDDNEYDGK